MSHLNWRNLKRCIDSDNSYTCLGSFVGETNKIANASHWRAAQGANLSTATVVDANTDLIMEGYTTRENLLKGRPDTVNLNV
jgi:hypothetical protein